MFRRLLKQHSQAGYLRDQRIQKILGDIPLELLFDENQLHRFILMDSPVLVYFKDENNVRTCSAPHMISMMASMLQLNPTDKVLILGSKGGLMETLIARASAQVYIIEAHEEVATITEEAFIKLGLTNVWVHRQNPFLGLPEEGQFDKILVMGAVPFISQALLSQLKEGGIIVAPLMLNNPEQQMIVQIIKEPTGLNVINYGGVIFQPLYANQLPPRSSEDITFDKIQAKMKEDSNPEEIWNLTKSFFDEFLSMPKIQMENVVFAENEGIQLSITQENMKKEDEFPVRLRVYFYNQDEHSNRFRIQWQLNTLGQKGTTPWIDIDANDSGIWEITILIPLKQAEYQIAFSGIDDQQYRFFYAAADLVITPGNSAKEWNFSVIYEGEVEEK
jgi:protein-L-isoaspartate(D-aspartate) O-methyltransferase